jgi:hypothetical protein
MSEVAKMLGVELGERFKINFDIYNSSNHNFDYFLTEAGIIVDKEGYLCSSNDILCEILYGHYTIKRKPWKPSLDEQYYYVDELGHPCSDPWVNSVLDITLYRVGNCYRTKEEAEANRDKWQSFCVSDEVLEV